jgi:nitroreductase
LEVEEAISRRRSVRRYLARPVPDEIMERILESARLAPSASNTQSWKFKAVKDVKARQELQGAAYGQGFIGEAPVVLVACADIGAYGERVAGALQLLRSRSVKCNLSTLLCAVGSGNHEDEVRCITNAMINVAIAVQNMVLAAESLGLGTCWVRAFEPDRVADMLSLPPECPPLFLLPLGYPGERPDPRPRKAMSGILI